MYLYDTRYHCQNNSLPLHGWLFPCINCGLITSSKKTIIFEKGILRNKYVDIPCCNKCINNIDFKLDKTKIYKIN
jgi:hypothetical protein